MRKILFKYLSPTRAGVLKDGMIRFSQSSALNDPFESTAVVSTTAMLKQLDEEADLELERIIDEYGRDRLTPENHEQIGVARESAYRQIRAKVNPGKFGRRLKAMMGVEIGVLSLSRTSKSVLMWSHYAQDHTGFVIGLDPSHQFFFENDAKGMSTEAYDVTYGGLRAEIDPDDPEIYRKLLCQKSLAWKYEKETRVFRSLNAENSCGKDAKGLPVHLFCIPKEAICTIIFGANSSPSLRAEVFNYVQLQNISARVYQARISESSFRIFFDAIGKGFPIPGSDWNMTSNSFPQCAGVLPFEMEEVIYGRYLYHGIYRYPSPSAANIINLDNNWIK